MLRATEATWRREKGKGTVVVDDGHGADSNVLCARKNVERHGRKELLVGISHLFSLLSEESKFL
jgi:hypothetical protein